MPAAAALSVPEEGGLEHVMLPHASVDGIAGLAELVLAAGEATELADLAAVVGFEIDDLFPLIDAMILLGFAAAWWLGRYRARAAIARMGPMERIPRWMYPGYHRINSSKPDSIAGACMRLRRRQSVRMGCARRRSTARTW